MRDGTKRMGRYIGGLTRYFAHGTHPGHFLQAVLENDLGGAICRGDEQSLKDLALLYRLIYNHAPASMWGSRDKVNAHLDALLEGDNAEALKLLGYEWAIYLSTYHQIHSIDDACKKH